MDSISTDQQVLIDKYFEGTLSEAEEKQFAQFMEKPPFRNAVLLQKELINSLLTEPAKSPLKTVFQNIVQEKKTRSIKPWLSIAAGILLMATVGLTWWANTNFSHHSIAIELQESILDITLMGVNNPEEKIREAMDLFQTKAYQQTIETLNTHDFEANTKYYYQAQEILAHCYFQLKKYEQSIQEYTKLINSENAKNNKIDKIRWNRLLASLAAGNEQEKSFQSELNYFLNSNSDYYQNKAKKLQAKLNSFWRKLVLN